MDATAYDSFYELDRNHFWRAAKRSLVLGELERRLGSRREARILDIGGACALATKEMQRFGKVETVDPEPAMVAFARERHGLEARVGSLPGNLDGEDSSYDVVTLLDVLEHIDDDRASLATIRGRLASGGLLILNVPAYMFLWSGHDVALHHKRRYTKRALAGLLRESGFSVERLTYWNTLLFPAIAAERILRRIFPKARPRYDVRVPGAFINAFCGWALAAERGLLGVIDLPYGSSLFAICRKAP